MNIVILWGLLLLCLYKGIQRAGYTEKLEKERQWEEYLVLWQIQEANPTSIKAFNDLEDSVRRQVPVYDNSNPKAHMDTKRKTWYLASHHDRPDEVVAAVKEGNLAQGMTWRDVWAIMGRPNDVNRTASTSSRDEQWIYKSPHCQGSTQPKCLYFVNGVLKSWQTSVPE